MAENKVTFELVKSIAAVSPTNDNGWTREVNYVSWNGCDPKIDIREWNEDHTKMSKGITLTKQEAQLLAGYITTFLAAE